MSTTENGEMQGILRFLTMFNQLLGSKVKSPEIQLLKI